MITFLRVTLAVLLVLFGVAIGLILLAKPAPTSEFQDRYVISSKTYLNVSAQSYYQSYRDAKRVDRSSGRTMVDAARDACEISLGGDFKGPKSETPFRCKGR